MSFSSFLSLRLARICLEFGKFLSLWVLLNAQLSISFSPHLCFWSHRCNVYRNYNILCYIDCRVFISLTFLEECLLLCTLSEFSISDKWWQKSWVTFLMFIDRFGRETQPLCWNHRPESNLRSGLPLPKPLSLLEADGIIANNRTQSFLNILTYFFSTTAFCCFHKLWLWFRVLIKLFCLVSQNICGEMRHLICLLWLVCWYQLVKLTFEYYSNFHIVIP